MDWLELRDVLSGRRLPAAVVDLDAARRNTAALAAPPRAAGHSLRLASKSFRHVGLLRRALAWGAPTTRGLMCFTAEEAAFLAVEGFDDLLVAYPTVQPAALDALARTSAAGREVSIVVDCETHVEALAAAGRRAGATPGAVIEVDVSWRPAGGALHVGARRSPLRTPEAVVALARRIAATDGLRFRGLMAYEAHVAGLPDANPFAPLLNGPKRLIKRAAMPAAAALRAEVVAALRAAGLAPEVVNGGGTGSVHLAAPEAALTEVTAGSGVLCPHLFDYFVDLALEPAAFFALEVCRVSDPGLVTCAGGGYVASGEAGPDKAPLPWLPRGLRLLGPEGTGEVQTPLRVPAGGPALAVGDPVVFRHAKAGELAERFNSFLLVEGGRVVAEEPTYRGQGRAFL